LAKERWAGAVDTVGSHTLANVCAQMKYRGVVTACGLAGGMDFPATVAPFILRGVTLAGIDSVMCPRAERLVAWQRLAMDLDVGKLSLMAHSISLGDAVAVAQQLLNGEVRGRVVVQLSTT
jgi:acrylyl-CoA reductase (NADPH)